MNNSYNYNYNYNQPFIRPTGTYINRPVPRISSLFSTMPKSYNHKPITFSSILNGTSKTLGVINQAIPVFYQVKPIWNNAKTMFRVIKGINTIDEPKNEKINKSEKQQKTSNQTKKVSSNAPTFYA